jgi:hypothetical protein
VINYGVGFRSAEQHEVIGARRRRTRSEVDE